MWSSAFLHADYSHLFFNLFTLWVFSEAILMKLGEFYYIIIYFLSLYFGNLFTLKQHKNQVLYSAVGASGAVTGIVYSSILLFPEMKLALIFFPIPLPSYVFGLCYILYSIYGMKKKYRKHRALSTLRWCCSRNDYYNIDSTLHNNRSDMVSITITNAFFNTLL